MIAKVLVKGVGFRAMIATGDFEPRAALGSAKLFRGSDETASDAALTVIYAIPAFGSADYSACSGYTC